MEITKVKILLEDYISREKGYNYGKFTTDYLNVNISITQDMKDMGMFTDYPFLKYNKNLPPLTYAPIPQKLLDYDNVDFNFINNPGANFNPTGNKPDVRYRYKDLSDYLQIGITVSGATEDRLDSVSSYGFVGLNRFVPGFNLTKETYLNYLGNSIDGITKIISINDYSPLIYTEGADENDPNIGTILQSDGIIFKTYTGVTTNIGLIRAKSNGINNLTETIYQGQAFNQTNSTLSALTIEEYLLHITERPKVDSDLFIDRGGTTVLQSHMQLAEIVTLDDLINYGNGYYNIV